MRKFKKVPKVKASRTSTNKNSNKYINESAKEAQISDTTKTIVVDDPLRRMKETTFDLPDMDESISKLRLKALEHARRMPVSYDSNPPRPEQDYFYSQQAVHGKSNWLQVGPTCVPDGQTALTYYDWPANKPALIAGRITSIVVDPTNTNIIYVGTALGGIWKTIDGGRNWVAKSDYAPSLGIGTLVMDPNDSTILYAGTGEGNIAWDERIGRRHPRDYYGCGILRTTNSGEKWQLLGGKDNKFNGSSFYRIAINPANPSIIFAATSYGFFRSSDHGGDWIKIDIKHEPTPTNNTPMKITDVVINPKNSDVVYVAVGEDGIYKSNNANDIDPSWKKIDTKDDLARENITRISLTISEKDPNILYALMASQKRPFDNKYEDPSQINRLQYIVDRFYRLENDERDGDTICKRIPLPGIGTKESPWFKDSIGGQGYYNLNVAVHPKNSDIVYLSGISLWKATRDASTDKWDIRDVGIPIHPDQHAFAFDPEDSLTIYAGNDGGLYKSVDGGDTWSDTINEGLCITQFEFMDQYPNSDAVIFGGTQDNGTLQYRNSPAFYFSAYGDGGFVSIDKDNPNNVIRQYVGSELERSENAGQRDSWQYLPILDDQGGLVPSLFYAPFTLNQENPNNLAFGSDKIILHPNQGLGWISGKNTSINLDHILDKIQPPELVSAISFVNSELIYAGTIYGKVIRAIKTADGWKAYRIDDESLSTKLYIWDVSTMPDDPDTIIVIMAGYGSEKSPSSHIWRGTLKDGNNPFEWKDISGDEDEPERGKLPRTPINALVIDEESPDNVYIGTDIGVFSTSNKGKSWIRFSENLPNCPVYDMRLYNKSRLLRIATHGRGIWERQLDIPSYNDVNLFIRNHLMDTGRLDSSDVTRSAFSDSLQGEDGGVKLNDELTWDMCPDIKIDSPRGNPPIYQVDVIDSVDYVKFESRLQHRNPQLGNICNIYVQIHNRGIKLTVENTKIRLFYTKRLTDGRYPKLPKDFWTSLSLKKDSEWKQIGSTRNLPEGQKTLTNTEPTILAWQWHVPRQIGKRDNKIGILVVIESPEDPIPQKNKILNVEELVKIERHIGLKSITLTE